MEAAEEGGKTVGGSQHPLQWLGMTVVPPQYLRMQNMQGTPQKLNQFCSVAT